MQITRTLRVGFLLALLCAMFANSASAQVLYGSIVGTVNDPSGAAVPGATVTATNKQTGQQRNELQTMRAAIPSSRFNPVAMT